jgi:hypothetical protein
MAETPTDPKTDPKHSEPRVKRAYVRPAITSTTAAFEHAVLACTGTVAGGRAGSCGGKAGSTCVTLCTAAS